MLSKIKNQKRYGTDFGQKCLKSKNGTVRPFLGQFQNFLDLNDLKFNAKFVSGGYILLYDTGFYSEMS